MSTYTSNNKHIVVIDDDQDICDAIQFLLNELGFEVTALSCPNQLDPVMVEHQPDLLILDVFLGAYDGRILARQLKRNNRTATIPIVMISANPNIEHSVVESGANAFLAKPFDIDDLIKVIQHCLANEKNVTITPQPPRYHTSSYENQTSSGRAF